MFKRLPPKISESAVPMLLAMGVFGSFPFVERGIAAVSSSYASSFIFNHAAWFCIFLSCMVYGTSLRFLYRKLKHVNRDFPDVWFLFLIASVIICIGFATYLDAYLMLPNWMDGNTVHERNRGDALYFAVVTFTTLGYGDIVPVSANGRIMASFISLAGVTHAVSFIAVVVQNASRRLNSADDAATEPNPDLKA